MRLYYYTNFDTANAHILPEQSLKLSQFGKVNDPFELLWLDTGDKAIRRIMKALYDDWHMSLAFISMSSTWQNPVMWAHYGHSHKGVCLGSTWPTTANRRRWYDPARLKFIIDPSKPYGGFNEGTIRAILSTKFKEWEYEREWRLFAGLKERDAATGLYFVDFGPDLELGEIIVGINCPKQAGHFAKLVRDSASVRKSVTIFGAPFALALIDECRAIAAANDFEPRSGTIDRARAALTAPGSPISASMLKDIKKGGPVEADDVLGDLIAHDKRADPSHVSLLRAAYAHLKAYEARRARSG